VTSESTATDPFGLVGRTIAGRFRIDRHVAEGGFGVVYRAEQIALHRPVALKVLKNPPAAGSFEREARAIARLKHPNIVQVHDFGVHELNPGVVQPWMALEWLEGESLAARLGRNRAAGRKLGPAEALQLLRPILQAIAFAHRSGVVHRDLKPANVFLAENNGITVPTVLDFGIAAIIEGETSPAGAGPGDTTRRVSAFSPDYAAPEQVSYGRTGAWTDVHALGLIVTEVLTGEPPYPRGDSEQLLAAIVSERRPTPGAHGVSVGSWETVLAQALARRPAERYRDAGSLLSALEAAAPSDSRRLSRRPLFAGAATLLVATVGLFAWRAANERPTSGGAVKIAVLPFENLTGDTKQEYLTDGLTDGVIGELGRLLPQRLSVIARTSVARYKGTRKGAGEIGRELGVAYQLTAAVARSGSTLRVEAHLTRSSDETVIWSDRYDRDMADVLGLQNAIARAVGWAIRLKVGGRDINSITRNRPVKPAAYEAFLRARFFDTEEDPARHRLRVAGFEEAIRLDPDFAAAYAGLAQALQDNIFLPIQETAPRAKAVALRALELDADLPAGHAALGRVLLNYEWNWKEAEGHFRRALELDPSDPETLLFSAQFFLSVGRFDEGIAVRARAIEIDPLSPFVKWGLGSAYYYARQYSAAVAQLQPVVAANPEVVAPKIQLARAYLHQGSPVEAAAQAHQAMGHRPAWLRGTVGYVLARTGRHEEALSVLRWFDEAPGTHHVPDIERARVHVGLGQLDQAFEWLQKAYASRDADLIFLRVDSNWDAIRADPRFLELVRKVGIPELVKRPR
jgi:serine/threonine-protein kinase